MQLQIVHEYRIGQKSSLNCYSFSALIDYPSKLMHILVNCSGHSDDHKYDNSKHTGRLFRSDRAGAAMEKKREVIW